ncbi:hypothetical protein LIER_28283 [Lithospermum erythrorhizon]|uniref:Uncharacterized protein n=1 Tax=Lithospermum erythrorhizon TaxID=34254 RepID=A0AAV3RF68_LITER
MANSYLKGNLSSIEYRPKLLKDFLKDDSTNDFGLSYPLKPCKQVVQNQHLIAFKRAKSRATTSTILAIHKASEIFIKTLKYFPFSSPSILSRNISIICKGRTQNQMSKSRTFYGGDHPGTWL